MKDINVQTPQVQRMIQELEACQDPWNEEAVQLCQEILAKAEADKNVLVQGYCHARLARFYYRHSDQDRCNKHIQLGIPMQDASGDGVSLAISCNLLGYSGLLFSRSFLSLTGCFPGGAGVYSGLFGLFTGGKIYQSGSPGPGGCRLFQCIGKIGRLPV